MERGSNQHSPRVDDELAHEVESMTRGAPVEARAQESRSMEAEGDGEPVPDARPHENEVEQRSLLAMSLRPSAFPADRGRLLDVAEAERAHPEVIGWLRSLPPDRVFANVQGVWSALGGSVERRLYDIAAAEPSPVASGPDVAGAHPGSRSIAARVVEVGVGIAVTALGAGVVIVRGVRRAIRR